MKRLLALLMVASVVAALALTGCRSSTPPAASKSSAVASPTVEPEPMMVNKDKIFPGKPVSFDPAQFPKTAMTGAPSNIPFMKLADDEGIANRVYPTYDNTTFKFLFNMAESLAPQWYYMFRKDGGTLNPALAPYGFKVADIFDGGHLKMQSNLMVGYYDFAFVQVNILTELWSGNETQAQALWRGGSDYVVIGAAANGGVDLQAAPGVTKLAQLDGQTLGIMNVGYHSEAMLNKALSAVGMATESAGGKVGVVMGAPGRIMNSMVDKTYKGGFVWGKYAKQLQEISGYHPLLKWQDMGYGTQMPTTLLIVRKDIIAKHPDVVQAVVQANYDASKQAVSDGEYLAVNDAVYTDYWVKHYGKQPNIVDSPRSQIDAQANPKFLRDVIGYMSKCGYFREPYTYDQLVDDSFYQKVKK